MLDINSLYLTEGSPYSSYGPGAYQYDEGLYDYGDGEDYTEEDDDKVVTVPVILSQPRIIQTRIGQDIILPCTVDNMSDDLEMLWSLLTAPPIILSMGSKVLSPSYSTRAVVNIGDSGSTLVLQGVTEGDSGQYRCSVAVQGDNPPSVVHTVRVTSSIQREPEITDSAQSESDITSSSQSKSEKATKTDSESRSEYQNVTLPEGESLSIASSAPTTPYSVLTISATVGDDITLSCHTTAIHTPTIVWTRQDGKMPSGLPSISGDSITLSRVATVDSGVYICTASNDDSTVSNNIIVNIDDKDTVAAREQGEKSSVNSLSTQYSVLVITISFIIFY